MSTTATVTFERVIVHDDWPDASYLDQEGFEGRARQYQEGRFSFVGVRARADITIPHGKESIITHIESPGIWGVEDDSGEDYFNEIYEEELAVLRDMLDSLHHWREAA